MIEGIIYTLGWIVIGVLGVLAHNKIDNDNAIVHWGYLGPFMWLIVFMDLVGILIDKIKK